MTEYITREAALMAVCRAELPDKTEDGTPILNGKRKVSDCVRRIKAIPAADVVERKHGAWVETYGKYGNFRHQCSECGEMFGMPFDFDGKYYPYKFCPNCGADMRKLPKESE